MYEMPETTPVCQKYQEPRIPASIQGGPRDVSPIDQSLTAQGELLDELDKAIQVLRQRLYVLMPEDAPDVAAHPDSPAAPASRLRNALINHNERIKLLTDTVSITTRSIEV